MIYDYEAFKRAVFDMTKIDLNAYKEKQMRRILLDGLAVAAEAARREAAVEQDS